MYRTMRPPLRYHQLPVDGMWKQRRRRTDRNKNRAYYHAHTTFTVLHDEYLTYMAENVQRQRPFNPIKATRKYMRRNDGPL